MRRFLIFFALSSLLLTFAAAPEAQAQRHPGSLGIGVGSATLASGLSLKPVAGPSALQITLGCRGSSCSGVAGAVDVLAPMPNLATTAPFNLAWNVGIGGALGIGDGLDAAAAFVLGLEFIFQPIPVDLVVEWRPSINVVPDVGFSPVSFGAHLRFYL